MPIYEYCCEKCGKEFEAWQRMSDDPIEKCSMCGGRARKLISQSTFVEGLRMVTLLITESSSCASSSAGKSSGSSSSESSSAPSSDSSSTTKSTSEA